MVKKGPGMLSDEVRLALKLAACDLHRLRWDRMNIVNDVCEGVIQTAWDTHLVGMCAGVLFRAQIEGESGAYQVNFLLSTDDLECGADILRDMEENGGYEWASSPAQIPCDELYRFHDLSQTSSRRN